jgi:hypothetical protein
MKHMSEEELFDYREGAEQGREQAAAHLLECGECRGELERMEEVFRAMDALPVPDPGAEYGTKVWRQIADRLPAMQPAKQVGWWKNFFGAGELRERGVVDPGGRIASGYFAPRRLMAMGAAAALLVAAFFAGRATGPGRPVGEETLDAGKVRERVLVMAVGEHLGKSEMILMELSNAQPAERGKQLINISTAQRRAEDLVEENRLYRQSALHEGDNGMASTLEELQRVLLEVANSPAEVTPAQFESIQKRIAQRGILLKVRVVRQELRAEASKAQSEPAQSDGTAKARNKV